MADRYWIGGSASNASSSTANWSTTSGGSTGASVPGAGDTAYFDSNSTSDCVWTITSIGSIICELPATENAVPGVDYGFYDTTTESARTLQINTTTVTFSGVFKFNCKLNMVNQNFKFVTSSSNPVLITFGELAEYTNPGGPNWYIDSTEAEAHADSQFKLEKGIYPDLFIGTSGTAGGTPRLNVGYVAATATVDPNYEAVDIDSLVMDGATLALNDPLNNRNWKYIVRTDFDINHASFDAGETTWEIRAASGGRRLPVTGDTNFGDGSSNFTANWHNLVIGGDQSMNNYVYITDGLTLVCNSLEVKSSLRPQNNTNGNILKVNSKPTAAGSWDFYEIGGGIYHSAPKNYTTLPPKIGNNDTALKVVDGIPKWGTISTDVASKSTIDIGPLTVTGNYTSIVFGDLTL